MMEAQDRQHLRMLESVLEAASLGFAVLDAHGCVVLWNRWMAQHSGLCAGDVLGKRFFDVFADLNNKRIEAAVAQALRGFPSVLSQTLHKAPFPLYAQAGGQRMQQAVAITPLEVAGAPRHCLIQVSDVSAAVNREQLLRVQALELHSQSYSDGLTGIANRRHFDMAIDKELRRARRSGTPLSLLMIDIDCFKSYNDHYGHQQGDDTLICVAGALASMLKRPTDLLARYGGEEFAAILPEMDEAHTLQLAEHLRERVARLEIPNAASCAQPVVTISIGVATMRPHDQLEATQLIGAADRALYEAKRAGRNRVCADRR